MPTDKPAISQSIHQASPDRLLNHSKKKTPPPTQAIRLVIILLIAQKF
ncbi:hypothetical protein [Moraxella cuniculi]|nr:hypothetical protein [Moraxella cuniculi]